MHKNREGRRTSQTSLYYYRIAICMLQNMEPLSTFFSYQIKRNNIKTTTTKKYQQQLYTGEFLLSTTSRLIRCKLPIILRMYSICIYIRWGTNSARQYLIRRVKYAQKWSQTINKSSANVYARYSLVSVFIIVQKWVEFYCNVEFIGHTIETSIIWLVLAVNQQERYIVLFIVNTRSLWRFFFSRLTSFFFL